MASSRTVSVSVSKLQRSGPAGLLVVRLMRVANDLQLANEGYRRFSHQGPDCANISGLVRGSISCA
jgi:hypothetical protein